MVEGCYDDAYKKALALKDSEGYTFVHPFDDENVITGQGTIALEILNDLDNIDAIVVPIGGRWISGIAYTVKQIRPAVKVYDVQAADAPSMYNVPTKRATPKVLTAVSSESKWKQEILNTIT